MSLAYSVQPPAEEPFRLAMTGMRTACLAWAMCLRYSSGPEAELLRLREVGERFGKALGAVLQVVVQLGAVLAQLLLEERVQHHGADAPASSICLMPSISSDSGEADGNQRRAQFQAEVGCR